MSVPVVPASVLVASRPDKGETIPMVPASRPNKGETSVSVPVASVLVASKPDKGQRSRLTHSV